MLHCLAEGKRVVAIHDYYEKREHSLLVLEYLQVGGGSRFHILLNINTFFYGPI
jgi:hypothetical protein